MTRYRWADCVIASDLDLPELPPVGSDLICDVVVRWGAVAAPAGDEMWSAVWSGPLHFVISTPVGRFQVENGNSITIDPASPRDEEGVRLFLFGSVFAALALQREIFILHASAVVTEAGVVAFSGESGDGKSTLAAHLEAAGFGLYADDTLPLDIRKGACALALPTVRRSKLLPDSLAALGLAAANYPAVMRGQAKRSVLRDDDTVLTNALPLTALYILQRCEPDTPPAILPVTGLAAFQAVRAQAFRPHYALQSGRQTQQIEACMAITATVPVFVLKRPWALSGINDTVAMLNKHWRLRSNPTTSGTVHVCR